MVLPLCSPQPPCMHGLDTDGPQVPVPPTPGPCHTLEGDLHHPGGVHGEAVSQCPGTSPLHHDLGRAEGPWTPPSLSRCSPQPLPGTGSRGTEGWGEHPGQPWAHLGADLMQAGGDVLGGALAAEDMALEHLRQLVPGHVGEVPARRGCAQGPLTGHQGPGPPHTRSGPPPPRPPSTACAEAGDTWRCHTSPWVPGQSSRREPENRVRGAGCTHTHPARGSTQPTGPPPTPGPHNLRVWGPPTHPAC